VKDRFVVWLIPETNETIKKKNKMNFVRRFLAFRPEGGFLYPRANATFEVEVIIVIGLDNGWYRFKKTIIQI
jgi:hypothetical protein